MKKPLLFFAIIDNKKKKFELKMADRERERGGLTSLYKLLKNVLYLKQKLYLLNYLNPGIQREYIKNIYTIYFPYQTIESF